MRFPISPFARAGLLTGLAGALLILFDPAESLLHVFVSILGILTFVGAVAAHVVSHAISRRSHAEAWRAWLGPTLLGSALLAGSILPGGLFAHSATQGAMQWAEEQVPALDAHREREGVYPQSLTELETEGLGPPVSWKVRVVYHGLGESFAFDIWTGPLSGRIYGSERRRWSSYD